MRNAQKLCCQYRRIVWDTAPLRQTLALRQLDDVFRELRQQHDQLPITEIPLVPQKIQGLERLRQVAAVLGPGLHDR